MNDNDSLKDDNLEQAMNAVAEVMEHTISTRPQISKFLSGRLTLIGSDGRMLLKKRARVSLNFYVTQLMKK